MAYASVMSHAPARITAPLLDVIATLLNAGNEELHGWAIIKATGLGGPTVYKILERLTAMGWITAHWDPAPADPTRPRRRYYVLTTDGAAKARTLLAERRPEARSPRWRLAYGDGG